MIDEQTGENIEACPHCAAQQDFQDLSAGSVIRAGEQFRRYQLECLQCGARGPIITLPIYKLMKAQSQKDVTNYYLAVRKATIAIYNQRQAFSRTTHP